MFRFIGSTVSRLWGLLLYNKYEARMESLGRSLAMIGYILIQCALPGLHMVRVG